MKSKVSFVAVLSCVALGVLTASAFDQVITDTTGYVTLTAEDGNGFTSFTTGDRWSDKTKPEDGNGKHYLVQNGLKIRTPVTYNGTEGFPGDSLTLDNGLLYLKGGGNPQRSFKDLRLYGCSVNNAEGNSNTRLQGAMSVHGDAAGKRTQFTVTCNGGTRNITLQNTVTGDADAVITVTKSTDETAAGTPCLIVSDEADLSGFKGRYEVIGAGRSTGMYVSLQTASMAKLGPPELPEGTPFITFSDCGGLFASTNLEILDVDFAVGNGGGMFSASPAQKDPTGTLFKDDPVAKKNQYNIYIGGGSTITGIGEGTGDDDRALWIDSKDSGGSIVLDDVKLVNMREIRFSRYYGRIYGDYDNPEVPIVVDGTLSPDDNKSQLMLLSSKTGPITLRAGGRLSLGHDFRKDEAIALTIPSLTVEDGACQIVTKKYSATEADCLNVTGGIVKADGVETIQIFFANTGTAPFTTSEDRVRLLSAANLSSEPAEGKLTAADFSLVSADATVSGNLKSLARLSVETDPEDGRAYLVCSLARPVVRETKQESDNDNGFSLKGGWDNEEPPSSANDYVVPNGKRLRASNPDGKDELKKPVFQGNMLMIEGGGDLAIKGVDATVNDLRLQGGSIISARMSNKDNALHGTARLFCSDISDVKSAVKIWISDGENKDRWMEFGVNMVGSGLVAPCWETTPPASTSYDVRVNVTGDNTAYTGSWWISCPLIRTVFEDPAAIGSAETPLDYRIQLISGGLVYVPEDLTIPAACGIQPRYHADIEKTGGTFEIVEGKTLRVESKFIGAGLIRKAGTGDLVLAAASESFKEQFSVFRLGRGRVIACDPLALGNPAKIQVSTSFALGSGNCLRIECEEPLLVSGNNGNLATNASAEHPFELESALVESENPSREVPLLRFVGKTLPTDETELANFLAQFVIRSKAKGRRVTLAAKASEDGKDTILYALLKPQGLIVVIG